MTRPISAARGDVRGNSAGVPSGSRVPARDSDCARDIDGDALRVSAFTQAIAVVGVPTGGKEPEPGAALHLRESGLSWSALADRTDALRRQHARRGLAVVDQRRSAASRSNMSWT